MTLLREGMGKSPASFQQPQSVSTIARAGVIKVISNWRAVAWWFEANGRAQYRTMGYGTIKREDHLGAAPVKGGPGGEEPSETNRDATLNQAQDRGA